MAISLLRLRPVGLGLDDRVIDVHVDDEGCISAAPVAGARQVDCRGAWLSSGWADLHVHVWHGGTDISIPVEQAGIVRGVTALADAGSAGEATFHGLRKYVLDPRPETIKAFINIGSIGLVACNRVPELIDNRFINTDRTLAVIEKNRDVICGIKVRASGSIVGTWGITPVLIAKHLAEIAGLPLMVHVGEPPPMLDQVFDILTSGDVVTHCFNGKKSGSIMDTPKLITLAKKLSDQGVIMDTGHGAASFDFRVAEEAIRCGLKPDTISTDLHGHNIDGPVYDLATTVSKLHAVGLDFSDCVAAISTKPREFLRIDEGSLTVGDKADLTVFDLVDCDESVTDSVGNRRKISKMFEPRWALLGSLVVEASRLADGREWVT